MGVFSLVPSKSFNSEVSEKVDSVALKKQHRPRVLAIKNFGIWDNYIVQNRADFESSPYNFERIQEAIDTDSYAKQAFAKYRELFWKEGWEIVGENPSAVDYLYERIDYMEIAMGRPFQEFLSEVSDNLMRFHNVFIAKSRGNVGGILSGIKGLDDKDPLIGFYLIPTETVEIKRTKFNKPLAYRQNLQDIVNATGYSTTNKLPTWQAEEVVHLYRDRKTGRQFGTPFLTATLDDLIALRQIEEDIQNLIHRDLFPLYFYRIGDENHPASPEEIDEARAEIEALRAEGALVAPFRHHLEAIGTDSNTLDASKYLPHFLQRVAIGLGVFPHHLGMVDVAGSGNRSMTDRLDTALYDRVKEYQKYLADAIRFFIFDELLKEGGFDPTDSHVRNGVSDRCMMNFNEIDIDTQIKQQSHVVNKVNSGVETLPEGRLEIGMSPDMDEDSTLNAQSLRLANKYAPKSEGPGGTTSGSKRNQVAKKSQSASKGGDNRSSNGKTRGIVNPSNQFGTKTSPSVRRSMDEDELMWLNELSEIFSDEEVIDEEC